MVKRLVVGLVLGAVIGAVIAAVLVQGLGVVTFAPVTAYLAAAATGVIAGLVAGKPIWAADGKIEAGLKAFFGALLSLGAMFALRHWVDVQVDLSALKAGTNTIGNLPAASLPIIAALLSAFYEVDNTGDPEEQTKASEKASAKGAAKKATVRVAAEEEEVEEDELEEPAAKKRRR